MHTGSDLEPDRTQLLDDCLGAAHCPRRPVERREEPVAGRIDLTTPESAELMTHHGVVPLEQLLPCAVANCAGPLGRTDDVGEKHGR
jgi:hypothetical protein